MNWERLAINLIWASVITWALWVLWKTGPAMVEMIQPRFVTVIDATTYDHTKPHSICPK